MINEDFICFLEKYVFQIWLELETSSFSLLNDFLAKTDPITFSYPYRINTIIEFRLSKTLSDSDGK